MKLAILLTKEDIQTSKIGNHYEISSGDITINFTPEAVEEFINDVKYIHNQEEFHKIKEDEIPATT